MRLGEAIDAIMRQRGPQAAWREHDRCLARLHESDHSAFRREFNRIASERRWEGRSYGTGKRKDTRPDAWKPVAIPADLEEQIVEFQRARRLETLDDRIDTLRRRLNRRADGWEWQEA